MEVSKYCGRNAHHDHAVSTQQRVYQSFTKKHTIRHIQYPRPLDVADIFKSNSVTNLEDRLRGAIELWRRPTSSPRSDPISVATRPATDVAATRRG